MSLSCFKSFYPFLAWPIRSLVVCFLSTTTASLLFSDLSLNCNEHLLAAQTNHSLSWLPTLTKAISTFQSNWPKLLTSSSSYLTSLRRLILYFSIGELLMPWLPRSYFPCIEATNMHCYDHSFIYLPHQTLNPLRAGALSILFVVVLYCLAWCLAHKSTQ